MFINYRSGMATIDTYRLPNATCTDICDIENALDSDSDEILTATIHTDEDRKLADSLAC